MSTGIAGFATITSIDYQMASARARQAEGERDALMAELDDTKRRDLDETRRLLYMALLRPRSERWYNLAGTLVNALAHHGLGIPAEESMRHVAKLCGPGEADESEAWARALVDRITAELGD